MTSGIFIITSLLFLGLAQFAGAAEIQLVGRPGVSQTIKLRGEIQPGDDKAFARIVRTILKEPLLQIDSSGGDVRTALQIGRILREHEATISVGSYFRNDDGTVSRTTGACYSACVLIFAGAVRRNIVFEQDSADALLGNSSTPVGVHRVYFGILQPGLSQLAVKREYDNILNQVNVYLRDMDVSSTFLPFMQSINPENMHLMTGKELDQYGLGNLDVVYEERETALEAALRGITSVEWRERRRAVFATLAAIAQGNRNASCKSATASSTSYDDPERRRYGYTLAVELDSDCLVALEAGISVEEYRLRVPQANELCKKYSDPKDAGHCLERYLATGRAQM